MGRLAFESWCGGWQGSTITQLIFDLNITDGIQRCRYRDDIATESMLTPGEVAKVVIKLYPTSNVFKKGHRIRVDVSSSNFPRFDLNPNTGEPLNDNRRTAVATNTVFHDHVHASFILLPVVPSNKPALPKL